MDVCTECALELPSDRQLRCKISGKTYCQLCFDMHQAIVDNKYMRTAQAKYEADKKDN